jgi:biopolymer transport protein ExbD
MEMSPLIDCVFLLLIFFMLSSTFLAPKIRLDLPQAALEPDASQNDPVLISIDAGGDVFVNNEQVSWDQVADRLRWLLERAERKAVTVRCDESAPHRDFVRVLDAAKSSGADQVNVAYQRPSPHAVTDGP